MSWRYTAPLRSAFDSEEEYLVALACYEDAEDNYADQCMEEYYERTIIFQCPQCNRLQ